MRNIFLLLLTLTSLQSLFSQEQDTISSLLKETRFLEYLIQKGNFEDVIYIIEDKFSIADSLKGENNDLYYYLGYANYNLKNLKKSADLFLKVNPGSSHYNKSRFFASYNMAFEKDYAISKEILKALDTTENVLSEFRKFQLSGISLLEKDYPLFNSLSKSYSYDYYQFASEENKLVQYSKEMQSFKPKSIALSGIFSAIVPGLGKVYSKKIGEGVAAFLANSVLLAISLENYKKAGISNYKTLVFGSLFGVFYIGNIYGSMVSVKVYRAEFYKTYENKILFTMHIPLRTLFN